MLFQSKDLESAFCSSPENRSGYFSNLNVNENNVYRKRILGKLYGTKEAPGS